MNFIYELLNYLPEDTQVPQWHSHATLPPISTEPSVGRAIITWISPSKTADHRNRSLTLESYNRLLNHHPWPAAISQPRSREEEEQYLGLLAESP